MVAFRGQGMYIDGFGKKTTLPLTGTRVKALLPELQEDGKESTKDQQRAVAEDWLPLRTTAFGVSGAVGGGLHLIC